MRTVKVNPAKRSAKRAGHVPSALSGGQLRLGGRAAHALDTERPHRDPPSARDAACEEVALIVSTLPLSDPGKGNRHDSRPLLHHVTWPGETRHAFSHSVGSGGPSIVLER